MKVIKPEAFRRGAASIEEAISRVAKMKKGTDPVGKHETAYAQAEIAYKQNKNHWNPFISRNAESKLLDDVQTIRTNVAGEQGRERIGKMVGYGVGLGGLAYVGKEVLEAQANTRNLVLPARKYTKTAGAKLDIAAKTGKGVMDYVRGQAKTIGSLISGKTVNTAEKTLAGHKEALTATQKGLAKGQARNSAALKSGKESVDKATTMLEKAKKQQLAARVTTGAIAGTGVVGTTVALKD